MRKTVTNIAFALAAGVAALAGSGPAVGQFSTSYEYVMLGYGNKASHNPIAQLQDRLLRGELDLEYREGRGYFDALLAELDIDPDSQMLVFSPTSLQNRLISPATPRSLFFNDISYLGFVQNSSIVEAVTIDDKYGIVFYTFDNKENTDSYFERADQTCLVCHDSQGTMGGGVPMLMALSSVYSEHNVPLKNYSGIGNVGDETPIADRWGGWYVTGRHGLQPHLGNIMLPGKEDLDTLDDYRIWNLESLNGAGYFDTSNYVRQTSDIVALMVLEHQITVQNQIVYIKFKAQAVLERQGMEEEANAGSWDELSEPAQQSLTRMMNKLVSLMVFMDAADISSRITGTEAFTADFIARGPVDDEGRTLRELDLGKRLFRYPLSYLVYTENFSTLPPYAKDYVYRQLASYLGGQDILEGHSQYSLEERRTALEILAATQPEFTAYMTESGTSRSIAGSGN